MRTVPRLNRARLCALGFALICSWANLSAQSWPEIHKPPGAGSSFKIAGVVVSANSGAPLARTRVSIINTRNSRDSQWMFTAEDGRFEFNQVGAGKYSLQGARRGFIAGAYEQHGQFSTAIVTGAALDTENLILRLVPVAMISGKVLDESGEPVRNASVRLYRENHNLGVTRINPISNSFSDDRGYYDFWPVIPGS